MTGWNKSTTKLVQFFLMSLILKDIMLVEGSITLDTLRRLQASDSNNFVYGLTSRSVNSTHTKILMERLKVLGVSFVQDLPATIPSPIPFEQGS
jgi:hypothetical protein